MTDTLSVAQAIDSLASLDRKEVTISGVLSVQREDHSLADEGSERNLARRLWIIFHHGSLGTSEKELLGFHGRKVLVTGVLDRKRKGHFGLFAAAVTIHKIQSQISKGLDNVQQTWPKS